MEFLHLLKGWVLFSSWNLKIYVKLWHIWNNYQSAAATKNEKLNNLNNYSEARRKLNVMFKKVQQLNRYMSIDNPTLFSEVGFAI